MKIVEEKCLQVPREFVTLENPVATKETQEVEYGRRKKEKKARE